MEPTDSQYIEVGHSRIHNKGVFAKKAIPRGTRIIEYVGERVSKKEATRRADVQLQKSDSQNGAVYIFEINKRYDLDGNVPYNTARFINHSCDPNCETENDEGRIWVLAHRDIEKGEELTYNYGYDADNFRDHPCRCGSAQCVGYIVDERQWPKLRRFLQKT
jgi:hypothetical protein